MFQQIFVPTQQHHSVELPDEFYGKKVQVIVIPVDDNKQQMIQDADAFYDSIRLDFSDFKFDREEANER